MPRQPYSEAVKSDRRSGYILSLLRRAEAWRGMWSSLWLKGDGGIRKNILFFSKAFSKHFPFLYHTTITSAFSSQESSFCLSLQFSERSYSKALLCSRYYHTSTPFGSLPVRSRQLLRTKFSSFSTILRLISLEAFQRRRASSLVNIVVFIKYVLRLAKY